MRAGVMTLESAIESALTRFANKGQFSLLPSESINEVLNREKVPNAPGVYIIFRGDDSELKRPLYIGKAGSLKPDGSWKDQGLKKRLTNQQRGMARRKFFCKMMTGEGV